MTERNDEPRRIPVRITDKRVATSDTEPDPNVQPEAQIEEENPMAEQLAQAETLAAERLDQLMRLKADLENYRKRVIKEQTELVGRASLRVVEKLLPVLDDLERALDAARAHTDSPDALVKGVELVARQLHEVLAAEGLERVVAEGAFDPHEHEAVATVPGAVEEPTVLEIVRPGYKMRGKTIRPALVNVTVPADEERPTGGAEEGSEA